jgi:RNA polymerase primary sigma factor
LNKAKRELSVEYGEEPSVGNLAWKMNIDQTEVRELLSYQQSIVSLDFVQEDAESTSLLERLQDENAWNPCIAMDTENLQEQLAPYMAVLSQREREVLELRLGMGQPRGEFIPAETVASILNIRPASVADVERRAIRKIRKFRAQALNHERSIA